MNKKKTLIIVIIAAAVLIAAMVVLLLLPKGGSSDSDAATIDEGAEVSYSTDAKGVHQAVVGRDAGGKITSNSYGTLMSYTPAELKAMHLENDNGTLDITAVTPEGEATVYTLVGFEEYDMQSGAPDGIANAAAKLDFTMVAGEDNGGSEFGFDKPRAVATITYTDDTKAIITVGADAPQERGTYVKFGDGKDIYLVETDIVSPFLYGVNDLISLVINDSAADVATSQAQVIEVTSGGSSFTLKPYTGAKFSSSYYLTEPQTRFASEGESSKIDGGIRGLYANTVKLVNPSAAQLADAGLDKPYATLYAEYSDGNVRLSASKPDSDGEVNLMLDGRNIVYTISAEKVPWVSTSFEKLVSEYVLYPKMTALTGMKVNGTDYTLNTRESHTTDDEGNESTSTVTTVFEGDKELQIENFSTFYDNAAMIALANPDEAVVSGSPELTLTYTYDDGSTDEVAYYAAGGTYYVATVNGTVMGHARQSDVTRALDSWKALSES